ncbi:RIO1 family protein [Theileria parva strain Muguga]|uniref:RIO1 family protein n=1 Tax=Theileria parva strain Muguga TaxID=333668 RepID=UPI001C6200E1|nr:RIO1 family protein [Theileria parva strain Muguga]EAN32202.2 RIO1 family protein [Theileria parva strain Muguga]
MKLDPSHFCYLTNTEFRVLTAIEIGMRNHQYIPLSLITTTANLRSVGMSKVISSLLKAKLIVHCGKVYDGYKLTFLGLDYLALRALSKRGVIASVGRRIGVGKEADVHLCKDTSDNLVVLKFHRLGRISFRSVKNNRDYMGNRKHASWMYLSQLAAKKEYSYLSNLYDESFPVPEPIDFNRHVIAMRFIDGIPLSQVKEMGNPMKVLHILMDLIVKLARLGIIHGDFNDFNLMIDEDGNKVTVIDFPQVISVYHENAQFYFDRDVKSVVEMFKRKFKIEVVEFPSFHDVVKTVDKSKVEKLKVDITKVDDEFLNDVFQNLRQEGVEGDLDPESVAEEMDEMKLEKEYYEIKEIHSDEEDSDENEEEDGDVENTLENDRDDETLSEDDVDGETDSDENGDDQNPKQIQIWKPHVKRVGNRAYNRRLKSQTKNKAKSESKKDMKQRKIKDSINNIKDMW